MSLITRLGAELNVSILKQGIPFFISGSVHIDSAGSHTLSARVLGPDSQQNSVDLAWGSSDGNTLKVYCTCSRFGDSGFCRHVAAALMEADNNGYNEICPGNFDLKLGAIANSFTSKAEPIPNDEKRNGLSSNTLGVYAGTKVVAGGGALPPVLSPWRMHLNALAEGTGYGVVESSYDRMRSTARPSQIWFLLDLKRTRSCGQLTLSLRRRTIMKSGALGKMMPVLFSRSGLEKIENPQERTLLSLLVGGETDFQSYRGYGYQDSSADWIVPNSLHEILLPRLCASGQFGWLKAGKINHVEQFYPLLFDEDSAWKLGLNVTKDNQGRHWQVNGSLQRGEETAKLSEPILLLKTGFLVFQDRVARYEAGDHFSWAVVLRKSGPIEVPIGEGADLAESLATMASLPNVSVPEELRWADEHPEPVPLVRIVKPKDSFAKELNCRLIFHYGPFEAFFGMGAGAWYDHSSRIAVRRDLSGEESAKGILLGCGANEGHYQGFAGPDTFSLPPAKLPKLVQYLTSLGWQVEADGKLIRQPGELKISLTSGVDWFELNGTCDFGGISVDLSGLLAALKKGEKYIQLGDGSEGMLPEAWISRFGRLADFGKMKGKKLRFLTSQAVLLDALLAVKENDRESLSVVYDQSFSNLRETLRSFDGVKAQTEPPSFIGELRQYQREGLGWFHFLEEFGFGGCLADDMGLGKTVQVLARLDEVRLKAMASKKKKLPSLVVVPKTLVFNWLEEAKRFTPGLRVLNYTGLSRAGELGRLVEYDLVVTTYGTLRRDIHELRSRQFDYVILDEAQAIKNFTSQSAKSCRLLKARRRLAMTGTPVENHLGELWSLFEFLNPGMLGRSDTLSRFFSKARPLISAEDSTPIEPKPDEGAVVLARALKPFLLRRTKQQVLTDLPGKTEQTLYCELDADERKLYNGLRDHYRESLLKRVGSDGLKKSKMHVLEALLRLRQASCHPGLLDKKKIGQPSSKLDSLFEQLGEVLDGGHKALVFSQFTSLLAIVRKHLDKQGTVYEYLDGRTSNRQAKVERFQTDTDCPLFLISLKAGGNGLNLTAADYVFILDPWWNPAAEAQAVDRAHRIGQQKPVFAYRLIAKDTVEEKILKLQEHKRSLADAILSAENHLLSDLTAEDIELLFS